MYITKFTRVKDLPRGNYIMSCDNYVDNQRYYLINGKIAKNNCFNSKYALKYDKIKVKQLLKDAVYSVVEISINDYKLYNI